METESVRIMRKRAEELRSEIAGLRSTIGPKEFELQQLEAGIAYMTSLPARGAEATKNAIAHHARKANPEFQNMTMKQLVLKALREQFVNGATSGQLLEFFARAWGRTDIVRSSFSPQLSRLKEEGSIILDGRTWKLNDDSFDNLLAIEKLREHEAQEAADWDRVEHLDNREPNTATDQ